MSKRSDVSIVENRQVVSGHEHELINFFIVISPSDLCPLSLGGS